MTRADAEVVQRLYDSQPPVDGFSPSESMDHAMFVVDTLHRDGWYCELVHCDRTGRWECTFYRGWATDEPPVSARHKDRRLAIIRAALRAADARR